MRSSFHVSRNPISLNYFSCGDPCAFVDLLQNCFVQIAARSLERDSQMQLIGNQNQDENQLFWLLRVTRVSMKRLSIHALISKADWDALDQT
jgi:hypothetical protein